jgi:hypothetical protein
MALTRVQNSVLNGVSRPVPGAKVAVLTQPATTSTQPGSPLASIFLDPAGTQPATNPVLTDGLGNYSFYVAPGVYTLQIYGNGVVTSNNPNQLVIPDVQAPLLVQSSTATVGQFASGIDANGNLIYSTPTVTTVSLPINAQSGTIYTVVNGDQGKLITLNNASPIAVTVPQAGTSSQFLTGWFAYFEVVGAGSATITPTISTIDGQASLVLSQNSGVMLVSDGTNYFTMRGVGAVPNTTSVLLTTGSVGLPAATGTSLYLGGNFGTPHLGRIFVGDGTGWQLDLSKRVGSVTTDLFSLKDSGVFTFGSTGDVGLSRAASSALNLGNGTAGDTTGSLFLGSVQVQNGQTNGVDIRATRGGISIGSAAPLVWGSAAPNGTVDVGLSRVAAGQLAIGNSGVGDFSGRLFQNISNTNVTPVTVTGTTAQTPLQTVTTLSAELNAVGRSITIRARGFQSSGATGGTITYKLAIGATNLITLGAFTVPNSFANNAWFVEFDIGVQTAGATGALEVQANAGLNNISFAAFFNTATITGIDLTGTVTFTLSSTATQTTTSTTSRLMIMQRNN